MNERNIVLIGFMGCGKTTVGEALAQRLGWRLIDTDLCIEEEQGRTIRSIFDELGEACFRRIESECIERLSQESRQVIATGGGVVKSPENVKKLRENGSIVYLKLSPETLYERLKEDETRPLLMPYKGEARLDGIRTLLAERKAMYENAQDFTVVCDDLDPRQTVDAILRTLLL